MNPIIDNAGMYRLGSIKLVPVPPDHEHYPDEELTVKFDLKAGIAYVRDTDWPLIREELSALPSWQ